MISKTFADAFARMAPYKGALPYSYSRAQTLERCPLQFEFQYRMSGVPRGTPSGMDDTRTGWMAHKILECTVKQAKSIQILTSAGGDFDGNFQKVLETADNDSQRTMLLDVKEPMMKALDAVLAMADKGDYTIYTERELQFGKDGRHFQTIGKSWEERRRNKQFLGLSGYVDLELKGDGNLLIFDYKTEFPTDERKVSVAKQMGLYAFCELETRPAINTVTTYCVYLKNAQIDRMETYSRGESFDALRDDISGRLEGYIAALENFVAAKRKNEYCKYCSFVEQCDSV